MSRHVCYFDERDDIDLAQLAFCVLDISPPSVKTQYQKLPTQKELNVVVMYEFGEDYEVSTAFESYQLMLPIDGMVVG